MLLDLIRAGDFTATLTFLRNHPDAAASARTQIKRLRDQLGAIAIGERDAAWVGESTEGHHDAATLALLAGLSAERAASLGGVSGRVAKALPKLFGDELGVFVDTWARLFQRSPKNWDRNAHYPVMFEWVGAGLVPAPNQDGAVNLWLQLVPQVFDPPSRGRGEPSGWRLPTLDQCPDLYTITLARLFEAEVRPGLGAAALDHTSGDVLIGIVCRLVADGVWPREETLARLDAALTSPGRASAFQQRWLKRLASALDASVAG